MTVDTSSTLTQGSPVLFEEPVMSQDDGLRSMQDADAVAIGEGLSVAERMIPAPSSGTFEPSSPCTFTAEGELLHQGQTVGAVHHSGAVHPVRSPFTGFVMGFLAGSGEKVRSGQPLVWLRLCDPLG